MVAGGCTFHMVDKQGERSPIRIEIRDATGTLVGSIVILSWQSSYGDLLSQSRLRPKDLEGFENPAFYQLAYEGHKNGQPGELVKVDEKREFYDPVRLCLNLQCTVVGTGDSTVNGEDCTTEQFKPGCTLCKMRTGCKHPIYRLARILHMVEDGWVW